jgi:hypothetical protein
MSEQALQTQPPLEQQQESQQEPESESQQEPESESQPQLELEPQPAPQSTPRPVDAVKLGALALMVISGAMWWVLQSGFGGITAVASGAGRSLGTIGHQVAAGLPADGAAGAGATGDGKTAQAAGTAGAAADRQTAALLLAAGSAGKAGAVAAAGGGEVAASGGQPGGAQPGGSSTGGSANGGSSVSSGGQSGKTWHPGWSEQVWVDTSHYESVWVPAVGHEASICNTCGAEITGNAARHILDTGHSGHHGTYIVDVPAHEEQQWISDGYYETIWHDGYWE